MPPSFNPCISYEEDWTQPGPGMGALAVAKKEITVECEEVWREISNYLNDEIEPHLGIAMAAHFKRCAHCTAVLDGTRNVIQLVGGDDRVFEIPAGASQRMYEKFRKHLSGKRR